MTDNEKHYFANDGSNWTTPPSPVNATEARKADEALDDEARDGEGFSATNEVRLAHTIVEGSSGENGGASDDNAADELVNENPSD